MTASPTQDTTPPAPVALPALDAATYADLVAHMQALAPDEAVRIGRGFEVLQACAILATDELGVFLVQTQSGADFYYRTTSLRCTCPDALHRGLVCKHSHAVSLYSVATGIARQQRLTGTPPAPVRRSLVPTIATDELEGLRQMLCASDAYWLHVLPDPDVDLPIAWVLTDKAEQALAGVVVA